MSFGLKEHIEIPGVRYDPEIGIWGMNVSVLLERPGYRVSRRLRKSASVGKSHVISKDEAIEYFCGLLPYVVAKRAAAPDGSSAVFRIGDRAPVAVVVSGGRGRLADSVPATSTVELAMPVGTFDALICGRSDAPGDHRIDGDTDLGQRIIRNLGVMP